MEAVIAYRDTLTATHPPLELPAYCAILKKTNRSGISGLTRVDRWDVCKGRRQHTLFWEAQWPIGHGRARHKKFFIFKYGEEDAFSEGPGRERDRFARPVRSDVLAICGLSITEESDRLTAACTDS